jgi:EAL domain-containing protein (putative c-di-GMP-specific phosphodiesterase class I)
VLATYTQASSGTLLHRPRNWSGSTAGVAGVVGIAGAATVGGGTVTSVAKAPTVGTAEAVSERVRRVLETRALRIVYQPIVDLRDGRVVAVEALSRFTAEPYEPPDSWFSDAWRVGLGADLELAALDAALAGRGGVLTGCPIAINLSPSVITHPDLLPRLGAGGESQVIVELTEHVAVHNYDRVRAAVAMLRERGVRLAVDDMGAGFASFRHIVKLAPDIIKLDRELVHDVDVDPVRRSLTTAMVAFAADVGLDIVAEGIETARELDAVRSLGVRHGQGMLMGAPAPLETLPCELRQGRARWSPGRAVVPASEDDLHRVRDDLFGVGSALRRLVDAAAHGSLTAQPAEIAALDRAAAAVACISGRGGFSEQFSPNGTGGR